MSSSNRAVAPLAASGALSGLAAALILTGHRVPAGLAAIGAAAGVLAGASRFRAARSVRGLLAVRLLDRLWDACLLGPLAWTARAAEPRVTALALVCLGAAFTASYERAKAVSLEYRAAEGLGYMTARMAIPVAGLLSGYVEASLWALALLTVSATAARAWNVAAQHERAGPLPGEGA